MIELNWIDIGVIVNKLKTLKKLKPHQDMILKYSEETALTEQDKRDFNALINVQKTLDKAEEKLLKADALIRKLKEKETKDRNRRVFLYGLLVESELKSGEQVEGEIMQKLNILLTRNSDRKFLRLPPLTVK